LFIGQMKKYKENDMFGGFFFYNKPIYADPVSFLVYLHTLPYKVSNRDPVEI
jgi:hypothetical protein